MKEERPGQSGRFVALHGEELEDLIEMDGPAEPFAETQAIAPPDQSCPSLPLSGEAGIPTGPGLMRERTERVRSDSYDSPPPSSDSRPPLHKAKTADLRRSGVQKRTRSTGPKKSTTGPKRRRTRRSDDEIDPLLGECLGSYRLMSMIGEGGMGRVYLAEHTKLGRKVALKLLRPEYAVKRDAVSRFFQEARAVNTIGHENIVDITDFVELDTGETYFIMELLHGQDLADMQRGHDRPMPLHRAMQISLQVCDALEAAHRAGIIHRDLKPDNIFIVNDGAKRDFVKLLDFGVAKLLDSDQSDNGWQTAAGAVIGTPAYMSPEQASGIPVDHRSDIYSLGAILYELFTGHPVFRAKSFGEFVVKHMNDNPIPPRDLADAPSIPMALEAVILRCLEKDPQRRYQSVSELREDLARATATVETVIHGTPLPTEGAKRKRGRRILLVALLVLGVSSLAVGAFWVASGLSIEDPSIEKAPSAAPGNLGSEETKPATELITAEITLRSRPAGAAVFRKGDTSMSLGQTPLKLNLANIGERIDFVFKLAGYKDGEASVVVEDNTVVGVDLEREGRTATGPGQTVSARPAPARSSRRKPSARARARRQPVNGKGLGTGPPPKKAPKKIDPEDTVDPFD